LQHEANWVEPLASEYGATTLHESPPNGSGLAAQMALGILEFLGAGRFADLSIERVHLQVEAMRLAFADIYAFVSDPATMRVSPVKLLNRHYLKSRAGLIDLNKAGSYGPGDPHSGGTVYLTAADANGMMVSYIQSNYMGFGSGVVAPGGIALQNRGAGFSLTPGHPNCIGPRKRPFHTIIPAFLMRQEAGRWLPQMSFGVMGGDMQPQGHVQAIVRMLSYGQQPQAACDAPRWKVNRDFSIDSEASMPADTLQGLVERGHDVVYAAVAASAPQSGAPAAATLGRPQPVSHDPAAFRRDTTTKSAPPLRRIHPQPWPRPRRRSSRTRLAAEWWMMMAAQRLSLRL
jgi:gamma-glutamyltranspeptidase/glutathione hydrolase